MKRIFCFLIAFSVLASTVCSGITIDELFNKIEANKNKIKDMQADITTKITSTAKGMKSMEQKGHIWTKGTDKTKMELYSPMKQITINNGEKVAMISPATGKKTVQDLPKSAQADGAQQKNDEMGLAKAKERFDFSLAAQSGGYLLTGKPKEKNKFMGKMELFIDGSKMVPTKISMFSPDGKLINQTTIEYAELAGVWIGVKNISSVTMPNGSMKVEMTYSNVKVNQGIGDSEFKI